VLAVGALALLVAVIGIVLYLYKGNGANGVAVAIAPPRDAMAPLAAPATAKGVATTPSVLPFAAKSLVLTPGAAPPPPAAGDRALLPAPDPGLIEHGKYGYLPVIGRDGRMPWQVYACPFDLSDKRPRIAIIVTGLGIGFTATQAAIARTPPEVSLAFTPFGGQIGSLIATARMAGHEVLLELPMEPVDFPRRDPGFNALLTSNSTTANLDRLSWTMSQAVGYVGLIGRMGGRFAAAHDAMQPVLQELSDRGLLYIDNHEATLSAAPSLASAARLPFAQADRVVDAAPERFEVDRALAELEGIARRDGSALGLISAEPLSLDRIAQWAGTLADKGIVLVPVSAIVTAPPAAPPPPAPTMTPPPPPVGTTPPTGTGP
jgi:polysaccharide deacetylase 2 family uncharacterized protein YibQ